MSQLSPCPWIRRSAIGVLLTLSAGAASAQIVSQSPLSVSTNIPGNLLFVPSVEWPTVDSIATLDNTFNNSRIYVGYFDSGKCYTYIYDAVEANRYFKPVSLMPSMHPAVTTPPTAPVPGTCDGASKQWSGNFLNWALTQTIDPFRKALTGGYRVKDTTTETWLEKAWSDSNAGASIFPDRTLTGSSTISSYAPSGWSSLTIRVRTFGNKLRFTSTGTDSALNGNTITVYDPATMTLGTTSPNDNRAKIFEMSVRVKVCDPSIGVEANCKQYGSNYKPEGLIQKYSDRIRYSVFGYLNDKSVAPNRDGGALRAKQKFVGPLKRDTVTHGMVANAANEWDSTTGVLVQNPDTADATATTNAVGQTIADSGVINYLNKFGEMPQGSPPTHKTYDPVSELYYAATRYLKNLGNVPEYTNFPGSATSAEKYALADGFPVITTWDDPIQYWCQNNAILGIGDVNTWYDKNLPGSNFTSNEPSKPALVSADTSVNVVTALAKVTALEGITVTTPMPGGRDSSAFIAGLAYDNHTKDMRPLLQGSQTASTYWVDVREAQTLYGRDRNQYWLAAKYGGFVVPKGYDPYANTTPLDSTLWHSAGPTDTITPTVPAGNTTSYLRPDNFFVASEADKMVESLTRAFAKISAEGGGSSSSLAANSTRLDTSTRTFQALFEAGAWNGDLQAFAVLSNGNLASAPSWSAKTLLLAAPWASRNIYTYTGSAYIPFNDYSTLSAAQKTAIGSQIVVDYLRGKRSDENAQSGGTLRTRTGVLGDIVNSTPIYVGPPNSRLYVNATFTGASAYAAFVTSKSSRTPAVYVGANDGMLHGFNANTGAETYAFIPNSVILNDLKSYSDPNYQHKYFVDGESAVADIYDSVAAKWKTVLVGTLGRGGPGLFALDITDPANVLFLWEKSVSDIPTLGRNIGKPVIAQVADGDWRVLLGNGPDGAGGKATVVGVGVISGTVATLDTGDTGGSNGLTAVLARDSDGDGFADTVYAGDLKGNLWKISAISGTPTVLKLFTALDASNNAQPITAAPLVGKDPATGKIWIFFGTGQYLADTDPTTTRVQTWYGLMDGTAIAGRTALQARTATNGAVVNGFTTRTVDQGSAADLVGKRGWYIDLPSSGERMVVPNRFEGEALIGTTRIPDSGDVCKPSGKGFVMSINPFTGARLNDTFFDLNGDGLFNDSDKAGGQIVSGIGFDSSPNNPIFIDNVMEVSLDDGSTKSIRTQGSSVDAKRMSWRELVN